MNLQNSPLLPNIDQDFNDETLIPRSGSIKYHLVRLLFRDLLGPKMGSGEIIENPFDQYTLGIIRSMYKPDKLWKEAEPVTDPSEKCLIEKEKQTKYSDLEVDEDEKYNVDADLNPMQGARSMGLSFVVEGESPSIKICCTWGRYENISGLPKSVWKRNPNFFISNPIDLNIKEHDITPENKKSPSNISKPGIKIHIRTSKVEGINKRHVSIFLINNTPFNDKQSSDCYVFQPQIRVLCNKSTKISSLGRINYNDDLVNDNLLFWDYNSKGKGHLCSVVWKEIDPEQHTGDDGTSFSDFSWQDKSSLKIMNLAKEFEKCDIRTEFLPTYTISQPDISESSEFFEASSLAEMWKPSDIRKTLESITNNYFNWVDDKRKDLISNYKFTDDILKQATKNLDECKRIVERIDDGIKMLETDEKARLAFCFMNKVMSDKNRWDNRRNTNHKDLKWYEFQMAFILQTLKDVIPGNGDDKKICDILWFPTGGGKTESYLGLMVFTFAYRRLLDLEKYQVDGGVSVLSRYTLRLLTIQQFTRSLGAVLAADMRRVENWIPEKAVITNSRLKKRFDDKILWGKTRFSLGLWIGDLTPNQFKKQPTRHVDFLNAEGALEPRESKRETQLHGEPAQIMECPCCGETLAIPAKKEFKPESSIKTLTWIIETEKTIKDLDAISDSCFTNSMIELKSIGIKPSKSFYEINTNHMDNTRYILFSVNFQRKTDRRITGNSIDDWWKNCVKHALGYNDKVDPLQCTRPSRPGYFFLYKDGENKPYDFAIHCPNKDCEINKNKNQWSEDVTSNIPPVAKPFRLNKKFSIFAPISAFMIDDQVYARCPTVVIATTDKFARLPFEPRIASLFGNVDFHDVWVGYGRGDPNKYNTRKPVMPFLPPSLIIQDELHLIEGPLGSMVGIYEMAIDILSSTEKFIPKYIASTATIKEAANQVGTIYRRQARIFPPHGITYGDNYFSKIKEDLSCLSEKPGRLYIGILAPKGTLIVPVKIWASLLSSTQKIRTCPKLFGMDKKHKNLKSSKTLDEFVNAETDWYRTLVGYFNAIRELSISRNLYSSDILRDVSKWSTITQSSIQYKTKNDKTTPALRYVPIKIKEDMTIHTVSVFCKRTEGKLSVAIYDNDNTKNEPRNRVCQTKTEDRQKIIKNDDNEFILEKTLDVHKGDLLWVGLYNYSDGTVFYVGSSNIESRVTTNVKFKNEVIIFDQKHHNSVPIKNTIQVLLKTEARSLDTDALELSSSTESQELPEIMESLQKTPNNTIDGVFTTSMFGTGIDIDRLGLMTVMGQPKSTSSYIQSTGRIGRKCAGLIVTWLRAGRVRDLNHYENFVGYHRSIHRYVEPISAAPFSEETMNLCMGPIIVAILRNARYVQGKPIQAQWRDNNEGPSFMKSHDNDADVKVVKNFLLKTCSSDYIPESRKMNKEEIKVIIDKAIESWKRTASTLSSHKESLVFKEPTMKKKAENNVVLGTPQHRIAGKNMVYKNTRSSLRNVEATSTVGDREWV